VSFKERLLPEQAKAVLNDNAIKSIKQIHSKSRMFKVETNDDASFIQRHKNNPRVEFTELDQKVSAQYYVSDPRYADQYYHKLMSNDFAWDKSKGNNVIVAVLDTGVTPHPDLNENLISGYNFVKNNTDTLDVHNHGTWVAGAVAASNNLIGGLGVAFKSKIMPLVIADESAYSYFSTMSQAIYYAADNGARVVNLSFHGACTSLTVQNAAKYLRSKGGVLIVAAGNQSVNDTSSVNSPDLTCVSATDKNDVIASFSDYGNKIDVAASGVGIYTTNSR
jgi:subtilisin family serine protease